MMMPKIEVLEMMIYQFSVTSNRVRNQKWATISTRFWILNDGNFLPGNCQMGWLTNLPLTGSNLSFHIFAILVTFLAIFVFFSLRHEFEVSHKCLLLSPPQVKTLNPPRLSSGPGRGLWHPKLLPTSQEDIFLWCSSWFSPSAQGDISDFSCFGFPVFVSLDES